MDWCSRQGKQEAFEQQIAAELSDGDLGQGMPTVDKGLGPWAKESTTRGLVACLVCRFRAS